MRGGESVGCENNSGFWPCTKCKQSACSVRDLQMMIGVWRRNEDGRYIIPMPKSPPTSLNKSDISTMITNDMDPPTHSSPNALSSKMSSGEYSCINSNTRSDASESSPNTNTDLRLPPLAVVKVLSLCSAPLAALRFHCVNSSGAHLDHWRCCTILTA